jgi:SulP family sulfate permease
MERLRKTGRWVVGPYPWRLLRRDLVAGLTVAAVAVPQAMAYALVAGIDPAYGLYTAIIPTALVALFGSSSHLIGGPTNAISLAVFGACLTVTGPAADRLQAVFLLAVLVGLIQVLIALLKLGDLTRYVSEAVLLGFMAGAGIMVALGQLPNLLGLSRQEDTYFLFGLWRTLRDGGPPNFYAFGLGLGTVVLVVGFRRLGTRLEVPLPDMLFALLVVALVAWGFAWSREGVVEVLGAVDRGLPQPEVPSIDALRQVSGSALAISVLGLLESLAIAKAIAARTRQPLDYNRQCLAEGLANLGGGFFQCMPGSGSLTRSAVNFQAGAATRMAGVLSAAAVALTLVLFAPLAQYIPKAALAGLLLITAWRLVDRQRLRYCLRATRFDAGIALATAAAAIFISIEFSILIGTFLSFLFFVPRAARLQCSELVVSPERVVRERQPDDPECTKLALFSLEGELFFGAAPELDDHLKELARRAEQGARIVVLRLKRARNPDMVCLERLQRFLEDMRGRGVTVLFCGVREDFAQALSNVRFHRVLPPECLFLEDGAMMSSTLKAVRRAYELLGNDRCPTCPRSRELEGDRGEWYYMI